MQESMRKMVCDAATNLRQAAGPGSAVVVVVYHEDSEEGFFIEGESQGNVAKSLGAMSLIRHRLEKDAAEDPDATSYTVTKEEPPEK